MTRTLSKHEWRAGASCLAVMTVLAAGPTLAQEGAAQTEDVTELDEIVVTGFRASLASAVNIKRNESGVVDAIVAEDIAAPDEQAEVAALEAKGLAVQAVWQSSLLHPADLPWAAHAVPDVFTAFRQGVERGGVRAPEPQCAPTRCPPPARAPSPRAPPA